MRLVLALLAAIALVISPVAAAARAPCAFGGAPAMTMMAMPGMAMSTKSGPALVSAGQRVMAPCCDHSGQRKMSDKACAAACMAMAALPASPVSGLRAFVRAPFSTTGLGFSQGLKPAGPERPPKSMA